MDNHCVMCGAYLADTGRMICEKCEKQKTELKPCPFCGGKNIWYVWEYDLVYAKCQECGSTGSKYRTMVVAKEAWNRRTANTPCDFCCFNPPSSGDGKPCTMCVASGRAEDGKRSSVN